MRARASDRVTYVGPCCFEAEAAVLVLDPRRLVERAFPRGSFQEAAQSLRLVLSRGFAERSQVRLGHLRHPVPMAAQRKGTVRRWLFGGDERPPRRVRLAFFAFGLPALAGVYAATESEGYQVLVLFALTFGVLPVLSRRYGVRDEYAEATDGANVPARVLVWSLVVVAPWVALTFFVVPESLGPWFWWWLVMWPWLEVNMFLAERAFQRDGAESWRKERLVRDSAVAGAVTAPIIVLIMLADDAAVAEAVITGVLCGFIVFGITVTFTWLGRSTTAPDGR